jgi:hypothetical protein
VEDDIAVTFNHWRLKMNIDDLTLGQIKQITAMVGQTSQQQSQGLSAMVGLKCIVRTYSAGVWFGEIVEKDRNEVIVKNARRMWQWKAKESISLSGVAVHGIDQKNSKIAPSVPHVWLEAIELIPISGKSAMSIEEAEDAKAQ